MKRNWDLKVYLTIAMSTLVTWIVYPIYSVGGDENLDTEIISVVDGSDYLGVIEAGTEEYRHELVLKNNSSASITVQEVLTGCGCIATEYENIEIEPQETFKVKLTIQLLGETSEIHKAIVLKTDYSEAPSIVIPVHGRVGAGFSVWPTKLDFDSFERSEQPMVSSIMMSKTDGPIELTVSSDAIQVEENILESGNRLLRISIYSNEIGTLRDTVTIKDLHSGESRTIEVTGEILPIVRFIPDAVVFVDGLDDKKTTNVRIEWGARNEDTLTSIHATQGLTVALVGEEQPSEVRLTLDAEQWTNEEPGSLTLITTNGGEFKLPVYLMTGL